MLAFLFGLAVVASLLTTAMIGLDILPASPLVMAIVFGAHAVFGVFFFKGYSDYRALHRLLLEGRGELFDLAIAHRIKATRFAEFRSHYALRRLQGLALSGQALQAIEVAQQQDDLLRRASRNKLDVAVALIDANLQLGAKGWAKRILDEAEQLPGATGHLGLRAAKGRCAFLSGDLGAAEELLEGVRGDGQFPLTQLTRSRNLCWLGQLHLKLGNPGVAGRDLSRAIKVAPESFWGKRARRSLAQVA